MRISRTRAVALVASAFVLATVTAGVASAAPDDDIEYVALGDSAAAGPLLPRQDLTSPACQRSDLNYPTLVAEGLDVETFRDVTCSGALTTNFTVPQSPITPPQYLALGPDTDLVTVHVGANDIGLATAVATCANPLPEPPNGSTCAKVFNSGGVDKMSALIQGFGPTYGKIVREIKKRSPEADVYFVGYGTYLRPGACHPTQPIWGRDADYMQAKINELNAVTEKYATAEGASFISQTEASRGHDVCAPPEERWFEGLIPQNQAAPFHPTVQGMRGTAGVVLEALGSGAGADQR